MNNKLNYWSLAALVLSFFIFLVAVLTAFIDSSTFLNRIHTTMLVWQLPLVAIGLITLAFYKAEKEADNAPKSGLMRFVSIILMVIALFVTNISKNTVQDVASNVENYVDIAAELIDDEASNVRGYAKTLERAVEDAEDRVVGRYDYDDYDDYDEEW